MANVMTFKHINDEQLEILVNGESVGSFNHDMHGWAGMEAAEDLATSIAKKLDIQIVEDFDE